MCNCTPAGLPLLAATDDMGERGAVQSEGDVQQVRHSEPTR